MADPPSPLLSSHLTLFLVLTVQKALPTSGGLGDHVNYFRTYFGAHWNFVVVLRYSDTRWGNSRCKSWGKKKKTTQVLSVWARKADIRSLRLVTCLMLSNSTFLRDSSTFIIILPCISFARIRFMCLRKKNQAYLIPSAATRYLYLLGKQFIEKFNSLDLFCLSFVFCINIGHWVFEHTLFSPLV